MSVYLNKDQNQYVIFCFALFSTRWITVKHVRSRSLWSCQCVFLVVPDKDTHMKQCVFCKCIFGKLLSVENNMELYCVFAAPR